jgi:hypothetical protein
VRRIGVYYNPRLQQAIRYADEVVDWIERTGRQAWHGTALDPRADAATLAGLDLLLVLGGDGTVLWAAHAAAPHGVPLMPVALGRRNFLATIAPDALFTSLGVLLDGGGWRDERAMLAASPRRGGEELPGFVALNDVGLSRDDLLKEIEVRLGDGELATYRAEAVIVATATGSTAYALSVFPLPRRRRSLPSFCTKMPSLPSASVASTRRRSWSTAWRRSSSPRATRSSCGGASTRAPSCTHKRRRITLPMSSDPAFVY